MEQATEQLYDVIIYEIATGKIDAIVGERMQRYKGYYNAEKRLETAFMRINDRFNVEIVESGRYKKGDVFDG